jgi:hypothetical protein
MSVTRLSDLITPEVFADYGSVNKIEKDAFIQSGIAYTDPRLTDLLLSAGGRAVTLPYFDAIAASEPAVGSDDPTDVLVPLKTGAKKDVAIRQPVAQAWASMNLAAEIAGADPLANIVGKVEGYWESDRQARVVNSLVGVIDDSVANHSGDLVFDISAANGDAVVDANKINDVAVIEAASTMGDRSSDIVGVAMHSVVYKRLQAANLIEYIRSSDNNILFSTYLGKRVVVDDNMFSVSYGTPVKIKYHTILFGEGAFAMGAGISKYDSTAVKVEELAGNGTGEQILVSRRQWIVHPTGYAFDYASIADEAPTYAELKTAALWSRSAQNRKQIKVACLISNG